MLSKRQEALFQTIVEHYIKNVTPVGSKLLTEEYEFSVSPATIRAEMNVLEKEGFLYQPFTSSGRIPTSRGYVYYVEQFLDRNKELSKRDQEKFFTFLSLSSNRERIKQIAQALSQLTQNSVLVGFGPFDTYYTGFSHLFSHPEFHDYHFMQSVGEVVDHFDEGMRSFLKEKSNSIEIFIGKQNPFHPECSLIYLELPPRTFLGLFGPMRMDYQLNYSAFRFLQNIFL